MYAALEADETAQKRAIAKPTGTRVVVVQILTRENYKLTTNRLGIHENKEEASEKIAQQDETFQTIFDRLESEGLDYELKTVIGPQVDSIVDLAADADLLIIGGKKRSPAGKFILGSVTKEVLFSAPCPVVFVRRE